MCNLVQYSSVFTISWHYIQYCTLSCILLETLLPNRADLRDKLLQGLCSKCIFVSIHPPPSGTKPHWIQWLWHSKQRKVMSIWAGLSCNSFSNFLLASPFLVSWYSFWDAVTRIEYNTPCVALLSVMHYNNIGQLILSLSPSGTFAYSMQKKKEYIIPLLKVHDQEEALLKYNSYVIIIVL